MNLPMLNDIPTSRQMVNVFGGYNHNLRIGDGEFYDMKNLSSDKYPVLSPRGKRGTIISYAPNVDGYGDDITALTSKDGLWYVRENALYKDGDKIADLQVLNTRRSIASMGAYLIVMPDNFYINTAKTDLNGNYVESGSLTVWLWCSPLVWELCDAEGKVYDSYAVGNDAPNLDENPVTVWLDTSGENASLKSYDDKKEQWVKIPYFTRVTANGIREGEGSFFDLNEGDSVYLGFEAKFTEEQYRVEGTYSIKKIDKEESWLVIDAYVTSPIIAFGEITRTVPTMDFIIESGNRLWGCCYDAKIGRNEIYASALGDFKNWNKFDGVSTDSYAASVGSDGAFTGAINHLGYPIFFKENCIHKVFGSYPANYQIQTTNCRGVQAGSEKSLAIVNETLFYKSRSAVCAYDGSLPQEISTPLGETRYSNAAAGALGNKYYISMKIENSSPEKYQLFVFDTAKGLWHKEDDTQATEFSNVNGILYYVDYADNTIKTVNGVGNILEDDIEWSATTGILETDSPDKKYISRMDVRVSLAIGARMTFYIEYDSSESWEYLFSVEGTSLRTFPIPVRPKRCDHFRLKIEGKGDGKIHSICKTIEQGSDA